MRIEADREACIGSGNCVLAAPAVFDQDDGGLVRLLVAAPVDLDEQVRTAIARCPSGALTRTD